MGRTITLYICNPALKADIDVLPKKWLESAFQQIMQKAYLILGIAQVNVRVDTGSLRDSGRVERGGVGMRWRQVRVRFGGYITNPKTGRKVDYAGIVEAKYPYLRPAINEVRSELAPSLEQSGVDVASGLKSTRHMC